jgi:hypothetical protein
MALKTEVNSSARYRKDIIDLLTKFGLKYNFKDVTRDDVISFLDSFRKPETVDPLHKWIGTYNIYRVHLIRFFKWLYAPDIERTKRPKPTVVDNIPELKRKEKSIYKPSDLWAPEDDLLFLKYCPSKRDKCYHAISKLVTPDRNPETLITHMPSPGENDVQIKHEPELKGGFKALRDKGLKISNYQEYNPK